jgi:hypothetical protein
MHPKGNDWYQIRNYDKVHSHIREVAENLVKFTKTDLRNSLINPKISRPTLDKHLATFLGKGEFKRDGRIFTNVSASDRIFAQISDRLTKIVDDKIIFHLDRFEEKRKHLVADIAAESKERTIQATITLLLKWLNENGYSEAANAFTAFCLDSSLPESS